MPAVGFHERRHTYASLLAQAGADLLTISKLLGHADTRVTSQHYAHLCDRTLANAVNALLPSFGHQPEDKVVDIQPAREKTEQAGGLIRLDHNLVAYRVQLAYCIAMRYTLSK